MNAKEKRVKKYLVQRKFEEAIIEILKLPEPARTKYIRIVIKKYVSDNKLDLAIETAKLLECNMSDTDALKVIEELVCPGEPAEPAE